MLHIESNIKSSGWNRIALHMKTLLPLHPMPNIIQKQEQWKYPII